MDKGPVIETERLTLRPPRVTDFDALYALTEPPEMRRYLGITEPSRADSFSRLLRNIGGWAGFGYGVFIVIDRASSAVAGTCGVFASYRGIGDDFDHCPEAGWIIAEPFWRRGYATEAMTAAYAWFDDAVSHGRSVCMIEPGNAASFRVAQGLGFAPMRSARLGGADVVLLERLR